MLKGIDASAPVNEIISVLAKHKISVALIDSVFKLVKDKVVLQSVVSSSNLNQETSSREI